MDRIQNDALQALNEFIGKIKARKEDQNEYSEKLSTYLWTLNTLKEELLLHDEAPLIVIERFSKKMLKYSYNNELFRYSYECVDEFIRTIV
ncbi:MAG: hypothetical protein J6U54_07225 [Clostridiales bacterium]|nr:hypothetical protein [Clostridiales bacterium]